MHEASYILYDLHSVNDYYLNIYLKLLVKLFRVFHDSFVVILYGMWLIIMSW